MHDFTQGVCHDGAAILKDGKPLTIEQIILALRSLDAVKDWDIEQSKKRGAGVRFALPKGIRKQIQAALSV